MSSDLDKVSLDEIFEAMDYAIICRDWYALEHAYEALRNKFYDIRPTPTP